MPRPSPETVATARERYRKGDRVASILADTQMSLGTLYHWLDGGPDDGSGPMLPPLPRRRKVLGRRQRPLSGRRTSLVARLWRTAERQVREIEARLARDQQQPEDRERDARVLAVLVRTLRELSLIDAGKQAGRSEADAGNDAVCDIDDLRRELARRVDALRQRRIAAGAAGDAAS